MSVVIALRIAAELFRTRVFRRQKPIHSLCFVGNIQNLSDTEIQKLRFTVRVDKNVRGLEVAMNDQISMRIRDCITNGKEQHEDGTHIEPCDELVDTRSVHVFHHEVRMSTGVTGVEQVRDAGMVQRCKNLPFSEKAVAK